MKSRNSNSHIFAAIFFMWFFAAFSAYAQQSEPVDSILVQADSVSLPVDSVSINPSDSLSNLSDSIFTLPVDSLTAFPADTAIVQASDTTNTKPKKNSQIDSEVSYTANDSIVFFATGVALLYGNNDISYQSINLKADFVRVTMDSSLIYACGTRDSSGTLIGDPVLNESGKDYNCRELTYNLKTKKAFVYQAITQEGEGYMIGSKAKKMSDDALCMVDGKYTVCDNHDHPHFYLNVTKGKMKPGKYMAFGPAYLVVEDVPLPLVLPFGFFPFTQDYSSGILMPSYADEMERGFGLINGGYYFAISDYVDLELREEIYTNGSWAVNASSSYTKKYKFNGSVGFEYRENVVGEKGFADYNKTTGFSVRWSHSQNPKANPNLKFSAGVNFQNSGNNRSNINNYAQADKMSQNTASSNINLSKTFPSIPLLNMSLSATINQNYRDSIINLTLPNLQISYSRFYPLKRKNVVGKERWYEKISMSYSGQLSNSITTKEYLLLNSSLQKDWKNGMQHRIPVSATFNMLKYINISPSFNYTERWYLSHYEKDWDKEKQREINSDTIYKFNRVYDFNMGVSASTKLYGFYVPLPFVNAIFGNKIDRVRHVMTPSIGFNYTPDFGAEHWGYYGTYTKSVPDRNNPGEFLDSEVRYSRYQGSLYGAPGQGTSGNISYSLTNNIEMKVLNLNDTTGKEPTKKISLIDNLSISGSYNMAADSMNWSMISTSLRIKLPFMKNYSLSLSTSWDPYMWGLNESGRPVRINKLRIPNGKFLGFQGTSTSYSYTFSNDTFKNMFGKKDKPSSDTSVNTGDMEDEEFNDDFAAPMANKDNKKPEPAMIDDGYEKVTIPWSLSVNYSVRYGNTPEFDYDKMEYKMDFTHSFSVSGSISLTNNWRISSSTSYDFNAKRFAYSSVNVTRNLHCWSMSGSFVPFGPYKSYSFHIGVNSSMLSDLKYDKRSQYGGSPINWY